MKNILRKLKIFATTILFWITNIFTVFLGFLGTPILGLVIGNIYAAHVFFSRLWARTSLAAAAIPVRIEGSENIPKNTPVIYMPNHASNLDWIILWAILPYPPPIRYVAKKELYKIPFFGANLRYGGHFALDRERKKIAHETLAKVVEVTKTSSVIIFPEGTRSWDGKLGEFRGGGVYTALKVGVPIVPVAIAGTFDILPRQTLMITPGKVKVKFGQPLYFEKKEEMDLESYKGAINKVREVISDMLSELEREDG